MSGAARAAIESGLAARVRSPSRMRAMAGAVNLPTLMDIGMPGLSGYDAARMIRAQGPDMRVPIVAVTGLGQQIDRLRSAKAGIDHHIVKPLDLSVLQPILDFTWKPGVAV